MDENKLGLLDLLAPQYLLGFSFLDYGDYLSFLRVNELRTSFDESGIVYHGRAAFVGEGNAAPVRRHRMPSGDVLEWDDVTIDFRLTLPRDGSNLIRQAADELATRASAPAIRDLMAKLGAVDQDFAAAIPTEFPGIRYRLELLVNLLTIHLGEALDLVPAEVVDGRVVPKRDSENQDVDIILPKMVLEYEQGDDFSQAPKFRLKSWGNSGFDAPSDLTMGELVRMEPPLAVTRDGRIGIGLGPALLDCSADHTPPEILEFFGADESFEGLLFKSVRFFYQDEDKDFAFNVGVENMLLGWEPEVSISLEASVDVLGPEAEFKIEVKLFDGAREIHSLSSAAADEADGGLLSPVTIPETGVAQIIISGGIPGFNISAQLTGTDSFIRSDRNLWDASRRLAVISSGLSGTFNRNVSARLVVRVEDATHQIVNQSIALNITPAARADAAQDGTTADRPRDEAEAQFRITSRNPDPLPAGYEVRLSSSSGIAETLTITTGINTQTPQVTVAGNPAPVSQLGSGTFQVTFEVQPGAPAETIRVTIPEYSSSTPPYRLLFDFDKPYAPNSSESPRWPAVRSYYVDPALNARTEDSQFVGTGGAAGLQAWLRDVLRSTAASPKRITVDANASNESDDSVEHDIELSRRRREVAVWIIGNLATIMGGDAHGHARANGQGNPADRNVIIQPTERVTIPPAVITAQISRPAVAAPRPPEEQTPQVPAPSQNEIPPWFRRLSFRVRLERNIPVLMEVSARIDFETAMEERLRNEANNRDRRVADSDHINPNRAARPDDGVVDFKINVVFDPAIHLWTETLTFGAAPGDRDGIVTWEYARTNTPPKLKDMLGALLVFAPILGEASAAIDPEGAADWKALVVNWGIPVLIGAANVVDTTKITLYGGELKSRQFIPDGSIEFKDASIVFDYAVEFFLQIRQLEISTQRPVKVRYKAAGFMIYSQDGRTLQPIFDASKGYELNLSDPGLFALPAPLDDVLKVLAARIARFNPLTLELDIALKVDLGVVTVDQFKIKWPLDPLGAPSILPTGVKVDLAKVIVGKGYLKIQDGGFTGALDLTLVQLKLRIAGVLSVQPIRDEATGRKGTAIYASLLLEFPSPIVIGATGLGLYGLSGLFAMHYKRAEGTRAPDDPVSPALRWLQRAGGEPTNFVDSAGAPLWVTEFDRWSFGVGVILGTLEGGFLVNLRGMFVLELPGPRILIFIKIQIIEKRPQKLKENPSELTVGILGIIDIDFNLRQLTIGVIIDFDIIDLIAIQIPVEIFFNMDDPSIWHLWLGTHQVPISVKVLNIVRGGGYFMIQGHDITNFPPGTGGSLPGTAVATGVHAAILFGSEDIGLYLRVAAFAHLGVSFAPDLFIVGHLGLEGELRIFIISIGARGLFVVKVGGDQPAYIHGEICGSIDLFFFEIEGCVGFSIGNDQPALPAPPLIRNVYLQSFAPVIVVGQGGDRPIDASLGDAVLESVQDITKIPTVPIDTVPVIQFAMPPRVRDQAGTPRTTTTFTDPALLTSPPTLPLDGWNDIGGNRKARYFLKEIRLNPPLPAGVRPPTAWRKDKYVPLPSEPGSDLPTEVEGVDTNIDLALFSRVPDTAPRALERSTERWKMLRFHWERVCRPIAPAVCVLYTFCGQRLGISGHGWRLNGIPEPDPPGTRRQNQPPTTLVVEEPSLSTAEALNDAQMPDMLGLVETLAEVIGPEEARSTNTDKLRCYRALRMPRNSRLALSTAYPVPATDAIRQHANQRQAKRWVTFVTGAAKKVTFFMVMPTGHVTQLGDLLVRELDSSNRVLRERSISLFALQNVTGVTTGLPAKWIDSAGPWRGTVLTVATFLAAAEFKELRRFLFTIEPLPTCQKIQLAVLPSQSGLVLSPVLVAAIEVCSQAEQDRVQHEEATRRSEIETLTGYLRHDGSVPLLAPDKSYTLTVSYESQTMEADGTTSRIRDENSHRFRFNTDAAAPPRLDPYVIGTTPNHEDKYHFYNDPVKIVFNDATILRLFAAYGKQLKIIIRGADGVPVLLENDRVTTLTPVPAEFNSPYRDLLNALINAGLLPCVGTAEIPLPPYASLPIPVTLKPLVAYTLDLAAIPGALPGDVATTPLYRRSFATSRFAHPRDLIADLQAQRIRHRALRAQVTGLPDPITGTKVAAATDQEIQDELKNAGEQALPAAERTGITIYWAQRVGATAYSPHVILIDAAEPIWRTRQEPALETVPEGGDPSFQRVVPQQVPSMEITETGSAFVAKYVRSISGTRTLVFLSNTMPAGATVRLQLHRLRSELYQLMDEVMDLANIKFGAKAPWEEDYE